MNIDEINKAVRKLNEHLNNAAHANDLCSNYEDMIERWNASTTCAEHPIFKLKGRVEEEHLIFQVTIYADIMSTEGSLNDDAHCIYSSVKEGLEDYLNSQDYVCTTAPIVVEVYEP